MPPSKYFASHGRNFFNGGLCDLIENILRQYDFFEQNLLANICVDLNKKKNLKLLFVNIAIGR